MEKGVTCRKCGLTSILTRQFDAGVCPSCRGGSDARGYTASLLAFGILVLAFLVYQDVSPTRVTVGSFAAPFLFAYLLAPVRALLHESGHAIAARLNGWRVTRVRIGGGQERFAWQVGNTTWSVGRNLLSNAGFCNAIPHIRPSRRAWAAYIWAATGAQVLAILALTPYYGMTTFGGRFMLAFAAINLLEITRNLTPHERAGPSGDLKSDGWHLQRLRRDPDQELDAVRRHAAVHDVYELLLAEDPEADADAVAVAVARLPDDRETRGSLAVAYYQLGRTEEALARVEDLARFLESDSDHGTSATGDFSGDDNVEYWRGSLLVGLDRLDEVVALSRRQRESATTDETKALWAACLAMALLMRSHAPESIADAAAEAAYAFERLPWVWYVMTARAMALVEQGRFDEGMRLLDTVDVAGERALHNAWRAVAYAGQDRQDEANWCVQAVRDGNAWPACIRRAEAAIAASSSPETP